MVPRTMMVVLRQSATAQQIKDMLEVHEQFIKVAVDLRQGILAGGGEFHADCEAALAEGGSDRQDVWGADWVPDTKEVRFGALINIRPKVNPAMEIQDPAIRARVEQVVRRFFEPA